MDQVPTTIRVRCETCRGTGMAKLHDWPLLERCVFCNGSGFTIEPWQVPAMPKTFREALADLDKEQDDNGTA